MKEIIVKLEVSTRTANMIKRDAIPLEGRLHSYLDALYEKSDYPQDLMSLNDKELAAGLGFMLKLGTPLAKVRKVAEDSGRPCFRAACAARGRAQFTTALESVDVDTPRTIAEPITFAQARRAVTEAIDEGRLGFRGGWVSSTHLDALIDGDIPLNKRRDLMTTLGYSWHPALTDGRVNNPLACDHNKKSRLYVSGWPLLDIVRPADVARASEEAQREK